MSHIFYFADDEEDVNNMEKVMLEYATMDRELNHYIKAFEETINQVLCLLIKLRKHILI